MKTKPFVLLPILSRTCVALLLGAIPALTQPAPDAGPEGRVVPARPFLLDDRPQRGFQPDRPQGRFQSGGPQGQFFPMLQRVLTDDQRASLREAMEAQRELMRELEEKIRAARKDLMQASLTAKFDEDAVRKQALETGKLDAELTVLRAKAFSKMKPALSADQIEQIKNPPPPENGDGPNRGEFRRRPDRPSGGPRDENDLPLPPKP